jgi:tetratricopeptide (TPR) repeat protein
VLVPAAVALGLAALWIARTYLAYRASLHPTVGNVAIAVRLDPGNANYHLELGSLYEYTVTEAHPRRAIQQFREAVRLDPWSPQAWLDLSAALELQGDVADATMALERADYLAPDIPVYQWPIGNFYLLQGNTSEAFRHFRTVLRGTTNYDGIIFSMAWKASNNPAEILNQLIPRNVSAEFRYLDFLSGQKRFHSAREVWRRILNAREDFPAPAAAPYMDSLIFSHHPTQAYRVWTDLIDRGLVKGPSPHPRGNLITDSRFERPLLGFGFGWRVDPVPGVYVGRDTSQFHSPSHSALIQFPGKQNLDYHQFYQFVLLSPNHAYHLEAFLKTDHITTDSGPRMEVHDFYNPRLLDQFSKNLTGTSDGWIPVSLNFRTGPKTNLVAVGVARLPSQKLNNKIAGRVWVDDVTLNPVNP